MSLQHPMPYQDGFYDNPVMTALAKIPRWTVSQADKTPVDMVQLLKGMRGEYIPPHESAVRGARHRDERCLVTLPEILHHVPNAANHAYYLQAQTDGLMIIDIEPGCPPEIAAEILTIPSYYAERSMSGRGYHIVMPIPENFTQYPDATSKKALQHPKKYYEILLEHYVTFTKNIVPHTPWSTDHPEAHRWPELYASLAKDAKPSIQADLDIAAHKPEIPYEDAMLTELAKTPIRKTIEDFNNDHSRFEFSVIGSIYNHIPTALNRNVMYGRIPPGIEYAIDHIAWLVYQTVTAIIPPREKHQELRGGMPLLFDRTLFVLSGRMAQDDTTTA